MFICPSDPWQYLSNDASQRRLRSIYHFGTLTLSAPDSGLIRVFVVRCQTEQPALHGYGVFCYPPYVCPSFSIVSVVLTREWSICEFLPRNVGMFYWPRHSKLTVAPGVMRDIGSARSLITPLPWILSYNPKLTARGTWREACQWRARTSIIRCADTKLPTSRTRLIHSSALSSLCVFQHRCYLALKYVDAAKTA